MSTTTPGREDLRAYQQRLQLLANRLSNSVAQLTTEATRPTGTEGAEAVSIVKEPTLASGEGDEEVARGVLASEEQLLAEVRDALARFDAGTFGRCEHCGRTITKARLSAVPYARRCIRCARDESTEPS